MSSEQYNDTYREVWPIGMGRGESYRERKSYGGVRNYPQLVLEATKSQGATPLTAREFIARHIREIWECYPKNRAKNCGIF